MAVPARASPSTSEVVLMFLEPSLLQESMPSSGKILVPHAQEKCPFTLTTAALDSINIFSNHNTAESEGTFCQLNFQAFLSQ